MPESKPSAMQQIIQALESCTTGGYVDIDRDFCKTWHFDETKVAAAISAARAMQEQQAGVPISSDWPWKDAEGRRYIPRPSAPPAGDSVQQPAGYVTEIADGKVLMLPRASLHTDGLVALYAAPIQQAAQPEAQQAAKPVAAEPLIVMTGYQLRAAAEFVNPDAGDTDQLESEVCIQWGPERDDGEGGKEPAGLRVWLADYPEEGSMHLDPDKPWPPADVAAPAPAGAEAQQDAPATDRKCATCAHADLSVDTYPCRGCEYHSRWEAGVAAPAGASDERLTKFGNHRNWELSFGSDDEEEPGQWCVHAIHGSRNDREWTLIGQGATPAAAIDAAVGGSAALSGAPADAVAEPLTEDRLPVARIIELLEQAHIVTGENQYRNGRHFYRSLGHTTNVCEHDLIAFARAVESDAHGIGSPSAKEDQRG